MEWRGAAGVRRRRFADGHRRRAGVAVVGGAASGAAPAPPRPVQLRGGAAGDFRCHGVQLYGGAGLAIRPDLGGVRAGAVDLRLDDAVAARRHPAQRLALAGLLAGSGRPGSGVRRQLRAAVPGRRRTGRRRRAARSRAAVDSQRGDPVRRLRHRGAAGRRRAGADAADRRRPAVFPAVVRPGDVAERPGVRLQRRPARPGRDRLSGGVRFPAGLLLLLSGAGPVAGRHGGAGDPDHAGVGVDAGRRAQR